MNGDSIEGGKRKTVPSYFLMNLSITDSGVGIINLTLQTMLGSDFMLEFHCLTDVLFKF